MKEEDRSIRDESEIAHEIGGNGAESAGGGEIEEMSVLHSHK